MMDFKGRDEKGYRNLEFISFYEHTIQSHTLIETLDRYSPLVS